MKVVSLFSGAGGLDLGFIKAGHDIIWANDCYYDAVKTYEKNIGNHIVCRDIGLISSEDIPECDIVIGGFPCQGFSVANMNRHANDGRNSLYLHLVRIIKDKNPKFFLAENVKGILTLDKGKVFEKILLDLEDLGYSIQYKLLNSANYGVPQKRERVFIIGVREDIEFQYTFPEASHSEIADNNKKAWVSVADAFENIPDPDMPNSMTNHEYSKYKLTFNGYLGHRVIDPQKPAPTVTARGDDKGGVVILPHPNCKRRMTCRELAAIQSFPLEFEFHGTRSSIYRQIGNAVPPLLGHAVAKQFKLYEEKKDVR